MACDNHMTMTNRYRHIRVVDGVFVWFPIHHTSSGLSFLVDPKKGKNLAPKIVVVLFSRRTRVVRTETLQLPSIANSAIIMSKVDRQVS